MGSFRRGAVLAFTLIRKRIATQTEYQLSFVVGSIGATLEYFGTAMMIVILVRTFGDLNGWSAWEVAFLYGVNLAAYTFGASFFFHFMRQLPDLVRSGDLDQVLVRPLNPLVYLALNSFSFTYLFRTLLGIGIVAVSLAMSLGSFDAISALHLLSVMIAGGVLQAGFFLFFSVPVLWQVQDHGIGRMVFEFRRFTNYPISIFPVAIRIVLTFILPYGFIAYYPAEYVFGKASLFAPSFAYLSLPVSILFFAIAYLFWTTGIKRYQGSGS